jgi:hypothetical protein
MEAYHHSTLYLLLAEVVAEIMPRVHLVEVLVAEVVPDFPVVPVERQAHQAKEITAETE